VRQGGVFVGGYGMLVGGVMVALRMVLGCCMVGFRCVLVMLRRLLVRFVSHRILFVERRFTTSRRYARLTLTNVHFVLRSRANCSAWLHRWAIRDHTSGMFFALPEATKGRMLLPLPIRSVIAALSTTGGVVFVDSNPFRG
jgi:hypothetical protein